MPRNGSGVFNLVSGNPVVTGTTISSTVHNNTLNDIRDQLTNSVAVDGQSTMSGPLKMGGQKVTGIGAATAAGDAINAGQLQANAGNYFTSAGTNTITGNLSPVPTSIAAGTPIYMLAGGTNTGAVTLNLNTLGAVAIKNIDGTDIAAGTIVVGETYHLVKAASSYILLTKTIVIPSPSFTGEVILTYDPVAPSGWVMMDDGTIGNASSGATNRANADTEDLFTLFWIRVPNSRAPVSGGTGASAASDFAAGKTLTLPVALGRAIGLAGHGAGLTNRGLGVATGTETVTLSLSQTPNHSHGVVAQKDRGSDSTGGPKVGGQDGGTNQSDIQTKSAGGGQAHNNMSPITFMHARIKL